MPDYWGATADPNVGYSPYSGMTHYSSHSLSTEDFTSPPGDGTTGPSIEMLQTKIHNMHPERIAALADQWQNAYTVMSHVRDFVFLQSTVLQEEHWKSPAARNAFMEKGPGQALVYLDKWMDAAMTNVTVLRHLEVIAQQARDDIDEVVRNYKAELSQAKANVDFGDQVGEFIQGLNVTWTEADEREVKENVDNATKRWTIKAQQVAYDVGNQYYDYVSTLSGGMGPPVQPLNAVLNSPGQPPAPNLPNLPGGGKSAPPPPPGQNGNKPAPPPPHSSKLVQDDPADAPPETAPAVPPPLAAAPAPPPAATPPAVLPPGAPPPALAPPLPPPPVAFFGKPPPSFAKGPGNLPEGAPGPGNLPQQLGKSATGPSGLPGSQPPNPGQLTKNAFQKSGSTSPPGSNQPPGRTLRRPSGEGGEPGRPGARDLQRRGSQSGRPGSGEPHQPGRPGSRRKGDRAENTERTPGTPIDGEEAFGRPNGNTSSPVLKNPAGDRQRRRPGSSEELRPTAYGNGEDFQRREGAAPPVLNRPNRPAEVTPPPSRRRTERERERTRTGPAAEWVGADEARAEAGAPVLDAPIHPPAGSRVSRLEEVPQGLRSRGATEAAEARTRKRSRPGSVPPELSKRRTERHHAEQLVDDEALGVVTDEQAFDVATPGGGVVTSKRDQPVYEPEPRRVIGGQ